jgi:hypothetical protein
MSATVSRRRRTAALLLTGLLPAFAASFTPAPAGANDRDPRATPVPGAGCAEVYRSTSTHPWSSGEYFIVSGPSQSMGLRCPLPLNDIDLSGTTNDNDLSKIRVHYLDTDGFGGVASVVVELVRIAVPASGGYPETTVVCSWNSNVDGTGSTNAAKATKACAHDLAAEAFYHFKVRMSTNGSHAASFLGISFPL